jgi:hypothetical protein
MQKVHARIQAQVKKLIPPAWAGRTIQAKTLALPRQTSPDCASDGRPPPAFQVATAPFLYLADESPWAILSKMSKQGPASHLLLVANVCGSASQVHHSFLLLIALKLDTLDCSGQLPAVLCGGCKVGFEFGEPGQPTKSELRLSSNTRDP